MSPIEKEIVRRKLLVIAEILRRFEPIMNMTRAEYIRDIYIKHI